MNDQILDQIEAKPKGVMIEKQHSKARLVIFFYTFFICFYIIVMTDYNGEREFDFINYAGKLLLFGYLLYHNFVQLKKEKTNELSSSSQSIFKSIVVLILMGILLIHSLNHFINIITTNWYSLPTLVFVVIILSIISLLILEFKYLKLRREKR